ncbi:MAG: preprotein translocase subunit SecG [Candidatus Caldarchaeum sp.]
MEILTPFVFAIHIIVCILITIVVLLQPGKSGDLGSIFGGSTQTIFGATGAVPFLAKLTRILALVFFVTSLSLSYLSATGIKSSVIKEGAQVEFPSPTHVVPESTGGDKTNGTEMKGAASEPAKPKEPGETQESAPK